MANRPMKRCSMSLIMREMQIKTVIKYHSIPIRMATIKKTRKQVLARMWRNWNPCALLVRMYNGIAAVENCMTVPQKIKNRIII